MCLGLKIRPRFEHACKNVNKTDWQFFFHFSFQVVHEQELVAKLIVCV